MKKIFLGTVIVCAVMLVACGGGKKGSVTMGSLSDDFDSLSYALGANIAYMVNSEMKDIPLNWEQVNKGFKDGAFDKASIDRDVAGNMLRDYFNAKRPERAQKLAQERAAADSVRMAAGDSTKMEYGADASMFATEGERDSISYALGTDFGYYARTNAIPVQFVWMMEAMNDVNEGTSIMDEEAINSYLQYYFMVKRPADNAKASAEWLAKMEKKWGVKRTESGLLYKINKAGDPNLMVNDDRDVVVVHYKGTNRNGDVFDATRLSDMSEERRMYIKEFQPDFKEEAQSFNLEHVIKGWTEGMRLVGKGGKITLWVPAELAYGSRSMGREIGPNEALRFDIEVEDVLPFEAPVAADSTAMEATPAVAPVQ